jgi:hypothetical protein
VGSYLGCEVEPQVALILESVLDQQRHLTRKAKLDWVRQATGLAEVGQVLQREGKGDGLVHLNQDSLRLLFETRVLLEDDGTRTNVARARKLDALLGALDWD